MKRETLIWTALMVIGGLFLLGRAVIPEHGMGNAYVKAVEVNADDPIEYHRWTKYENVKASEYFAAERVNPDQTEFSRSLPRTIGIWIAAFFTLAIFSFLYRDNPAYKFAESVVVGVSAAYWMVVGFWNVIVPNLVGRLWPETIKAWAMPGLEVDGYQNLAYLVPLILGVMLLWRLSPTGGWIARWPLSFIVGIFCGLRLISFLHADFLSQIRNSVAPIAAMQEGSFAFWDSFLNILSLVGVLSCLVYFFFSFEHKGVVGKTAKLGMYYLMVTFGAAFGFTVMGRIALLAIRLEFLFDDWLWLIVPIGKRIGL